MCDSLHDNLVLKRILIITYSVACIIALLIPILVWPVQHWSGDRTINEKDNDTFLYTTPQGLQFIYAEMDKFHEARPDDVVTWFLEGNTTDFNQIKVIRIHVGPTSKTDQVIMVIGAMNPAAWFTAMTSLYLISGLLNDCHFTVPLLTDYTWIFVPVANPDGYDYVMRPVDSDDQRAPVEWHKNMRTVEYQSECRGVHLDRNWPFHFQEHKLIDPEPCDHDYGGPYPFSEMESNSIQKLIEKYRVHLKMFIYLTGNPNNARISFPWSFTLARPYEKDHLEEWSRKASRRVRLHTNADFIVMQRSHGLRISGTMTDYVMGYMGVNHTFIVEARGESLPYKGMDISSIVKQIQVIIMTLGREYNEHGGASCSHPLALTGVVTLALGIRAV